MRDRPEAPATLLQERDGLLGTEEWRRRGFTPLELLELLSVRQFEVFWLSEERAHDRSLIAKVHDGLVTAGIEK